MPYLILYLNEPNQIGLRRLNLTIPQFLRRQADILQNIGYTLINCYVAGPYFIKLRLTYIQLENFGNFYNLRTPGGHFLRLNVRNISQVNHALLVNTLELIKNFLLKKVNYIFRNGFDEVDDEGNELLAHIFDSLERLTALNDFPYQLEC